MSKTEETQGDLAHALLCEMDCAGDLPEDGLSVASILDDLAMAGLELRRAEPDEDGLTSTTKAYYQELAGS